MVSKKRLKDFNNLEQFPDLKEALIPSIKTLPIGAMNTKVIINKGEIVERVYKTPKGDVISLVPTKAIEKVA